jgi:regulator of sirC expression with transglutaminase-like and TPR domain
MSQESREQFVAEVRQNDEWAIRLDRALICIAAEAHTDLGDVTAVLRRETNRLDALAERVPVDGRPDQRLRNALAEFHGEPADYRHLESSLLPDVLSRHRGLPILLSAVWTEVARRAEIPAYGVGLPGHFVVGIGDPYGNRVLVNPYDRGALLPYDKARELVATTGRTLRPEHLEPHSPIDTLARVLGNITVWARDPERARQRLWSIELALLLPRRSLGLTREYGEALSGVGRYAEASQVLEEYADVVATQMPLEAENARQSARRARARLN